MVECLTGDRGAAPHWCHCVVSLSKNINPSLVLVQPRKTCPFITERLLMGHKESIQTNKRVLIRDLSVKIFRVNMVVINMIVCFSMFDSDDVQSYKVACC